MKKIMSIVGARPNFMKVAPLHRALQKYSFIVQHIIVHTGQHYDEKMSDAFFRDLEMPKPDYFLGVGSGSHAVQTAKVMIEFEKVLIAEQPDLLIVVGDVNSTIACALTAVKLGVKVAHVEGGLRSFDRSMPEEINRMATDAICNYCFITEPSALTNLKSENFPEENTFLTGNTMIDSQVFALPVSEKSDILSTLSLDAQKFVLITTHRPSNVDDPKQLEMLLNVFGDLSEKIKVVFPIHPRTRKNLSNLGLDSYIKGKPNLILLEPLGYIDFLALMKKSAFVITDSGGIQEETTFLGIHCITIRTTTERPVTVEIGTNVLIEPKLEAINSAINDYFAYGPKKGKIPEFWDGRSGERIAEIIIKKLIN